MAACAAIAAAPTAFAQVPASVAATPIMGITLPGYVPTLVGNSVPLGLAPLYHVQDPTTGDHFYTDSYADFQDAMHNHGYINSTSSGVACYVFPGGSAPRGADVRGVLRADGPALHDDGRELLQRGLVGAGLPPRRRQVLRPALTPSRPATPSSYVKLSRRFL